jgi:hypothetical protein
MTCVIYSEAKYITSRIIPVKIKVIPNLRKPFGFHTSFLNISDGPITSFPNALAVAANIAAPRLVRLIPPEPIKSKAPTMMETNPSTKKASVDEIVECDGRNQ